MTTREPDTPFVAPTWCGEPSVGRESLRSRLARVRLLILDVDGVLTDGGMYVAPGLEVKRFNVRDATGIKYLRRSGVEVAFVTGRASPPVEELARELEVRECHQKALRKWPVVQGVIERAGLALTEVAYMGDDLVDLPAMARVGVAATVSDAVAEVRMRADLVTQSAGGCGAVREMAEALLRARDLWETIVRRYLDV